MREVRVVVILSVASAMLLPPWQQGTASQWSSRANIGGVLSEVKDSDDARKTLDEHDSPDEPPEVPDVSAAISEAKAAAEQEVNRALWLGCGCVLTIIGVVVAYNVNPSPPQGRLIGKSPLYIDAFTEAYVDRAKRIQVEYAVKGALGTVGLAAALVGCFMLTFDMADPWNPSGIGR